MRLLFTATILLFSLILNAPAKAEEAPQISTKLVYAFTTAPVQKNGAVFLEIKNRGAQDKLINASADVSERVELHTHIMEDGVMMMRKVEGYDLPTDGVITLEPMGHHIMLMGLKAPLELGTSFPLTLEFEKHKPIEVDVIVLPAGVTQGAH